MPVQLTSNEARVIGCLIEKALTTPDQYPLSLNALTNACNQKSNREPVLNLIEREVQDTVDALLRKHLILERSGFGSRVPKYQHRFCNTGFGSLAFNPVETAIVCELLIRGAQTPGELRGRIPRLCELQTPDQVEQALANLASRADGPFVVQLPREAGRRDSRYAHLLSGDIDVAALASAASTQDVERPAATRQEGGSSPTERIAVLETQVAELRAELQALQKKLGD